jgi:glycine amidinotransferase
MQQITRNLKQPPAPVAYPFHLAHSAVTCPVNSHNEWDPLEEVIVGSLDDAMFPDWTTINEVTMPPGDWNFIEQRIGGKGIPYPEAIGTAARKDRAEFIHILEAEGVRVRQVDRSNFSAAFATPEWQVSSGFCAANPRDPFLVIGNEIIETPMADRSRYFESWAYRSLFKEYFHAGAKWTSAPKPQLLDELYDEGYTVPSKAEKMRYIVTDFEPVFDAADCVRCGRDIFMQQSNVTNRSGILWLQRHLGDAYRVHEIHNLSPEAIHIDTTFMPLAPGKLLINPDWIDVNKLPSILKSWDILVAPEPMRNKDPLGVVSKWISINLLMLDEERVIVERQQESLIKALKDWGFQPIPCSFDAYYPFLGSFHCATLDVRRRGVLQSYF